MSKEVEFILAKSGDIIAARSGGVASIGDDSSWWDKIWNRMDDFAGTAHSHPSGMTLPSWTDLTTWQAYETALAESYAWYIVTDVGVYAYTLDDVRNEKLAYTAKWLEEDPWWVPMIRELSYGRKDND